MKQEIPRPDDEKYSDAENFIRTSMYTGHVGSRWYTPYLHVVTSIRPTMSCLRFFPGFEETIANCLYPGGYSLLHVGVCCKSLASH